MTREVTLENLPELEIEDSKNVDDVEEEHLDYSELFEISSYGADYTIDSIAKRMKNKLLYDQIFRGHIFGR